MGHPDTPSHTHTHPNPPNSEMIKNWRKNACNPNPYTIFITPGGAAHHFADNIDLLYL